MGRVGPATLEVARVMRRFLLLVFVSCTAATVAFSLWPRQLDGYLALFERRTMVKTAGWPSPCWPC